MNATYAGLLLPREKRIKGKERKKNNTETTVLYYPMIYYAITIQPILTYTNDANGNST